MHTKSIYVEIDLEYYEEDICDDCESKIIAKHNTRIIEQLQYRANTIITKKSLTDIIEMSKLMELILQLRA